MWTSVSIAFSFSSQYAGTNCKTSMVRLCHLPVQSLSMEAHCAWPLSLRDLVKELGLKCAMEGQSVGTVVMSVTVMLEIARGALLSVGAIKQSQFCVVSISFRASC